MSNWFFFSDFMLPALLPALGIAIVAALMSVLILAHRLSFLVVGVSHASLAGMGLAVHLALPLLPLASACAVLVALLLASMPRNSGIEEDSGTGILFAISMAIGALLIATAPRGQTDLYGLMFGDVLTISADDIRWLWLAIPIVLASLVFAARPWWHMAYDMDSVAASGTRIQFYRLLLHGIIGITVILCVKLAGIILTTGLLVLPAACAWLYAKGLWALWGVSVTTAILSVPMGMQLSYSLDWPTGPCIVLILGAIFLLTWLITWIMQWRIIK
ncbi:MAG: metal ABC transporter permease [Mariprofundales bacterium]